MTSAPPSLVTHPGMPAHRDHGEDWAVAILRWFSTTIPVVLVAVVIAPFVVAGGRLLPWQPVMPELGTMIQIAVRMIDGQVVFDTLTSANFAYTPFGALLIAPLGLSGPLLWQLVLLIASVSALQHLVARLLGLSGHQLVLVGSLTVILVEPVRMTLGVGQLSLLVMLLVVVDLIEPLRPRESQPRLLPQGTLTGVAGGIALTPIWVLVALLLSGRRRVALTGFAATLGCLLLGWIVMPGQSESLLEDSSRSTYADALWASNQSLVAALVRWGSPQIWAQLLALAVAAGGAWAAARWWRSQPVLGLGLVMVASLMVRDPAWTWQFVGVLVLAAGLLRAARHLPRSLLVIGGLWAVWTSVALPQLLASNSPVPSGPEVALASVGPVLVAILVGVAAVCAPPTNQRVVPHPTGKAGGSGI